jgi:hypothetical protein
MGLGKTVQSIALILANREDDISEGSSIPSPLPYVSDGVTAELKTQHKAIVKSAKLAAKQAAAQLKKKGKSHENEEIPPALPFVEESLPEMYTAPPCAHATPELVAAAEPISRAWTPLKDARTALNFLAPPTPGRATLVICPVVALTQWRAEIARHTSPGALSVLVYHGSQRSLSEAEISKFDVVLTTYSVLEVEVSSPQLICIGCVDVWCVMRSLP